MWHHLLYTVSEFEFAKFEIGCDKAWTYSRINIILNPVTSNFRTLYLIANSLVNFHSRTTNTINQWWVVVNCCHHRNGILKENLGYRLRRLRDLTSHPSSGLNCNKHISYGVCSKYKLYRSFLNWNSLTVIYLIKRSTAVFLNLFYSRHLSLVLEQFGSTHNLQFISK